MNNDQLMQAVANLIKVKGRYHTEQAYKQVVEAYDAALTAAQSGKDEREAFEACAMPDNVQARKDVEGNYCDVGMSAAWTAWQVRASLAKVQEPVATVKSWNPSHTYGLEISTPLPVGAKLYAAPQAKQEAGKDAQDAILTGLKKAVDAVKGNGMWRPCSGCYETEDGHAVGRYPFSDALGCSLGSGCPECGGLGATWEDLSDYEPYAEATELSEDGIYCKGCDCPDDELDPCRTAERLAKEKSAAMKASTAQAATVQELDNILQELVDIAQEDDMGYGAPAAQADTQQSKKGEGE